MKNDVDRRDAMNILGSFHLFSSWRTFYNVFNKEMVVAQDKSFLMRGCCYPLVF